MPRLQPPGRVTLHAAGPAAIPARSLVLPGSLSAMTARTFNFAPGPATLPLPVPADQFTSSQADVNGAPATVLVTRDRTLAAVVWVEEGIVTVVAGSLDDDEVLSVAEGLR